MRWSLSSISLLKETSSEIVSKSHDLLLRAGMIQMVSAGIYSWMPLGLRVLRKVEKIIRTEISAIGFEEIIMPTIQTASLWKKTGRYDLYGEEMLKLQDREGGEFVYAPTCEECVTNIFSKHNFSHNNLPKKLFNIQWKFRDEKRPRFGLIRCKEFLMKDGYSFHLNDESMLETYKEIFETYMKIFQKLNLKVIPAKADNGEMGGDLSHDFHVITSSGEDTLWFDKHYLSSEHISFEDLSKFPASTYEELLDNKPSEKARTLEVGHIFNLGTRYTQAMDVKVDTGNGFVNPIMGCFGLGISRIVAALIEQHYDEKGMRWPKNVSPYKICLINLHPKKQACSDFCDDLYGKIKDSDEVLYDDRIKATPGEKFTTADLVGCTYQIIVGAKDLENSIITIRNRFLSTEEKINILEIEEYIRDILM